MTNVLHIFGSQDTETPFYEYRNTRPILLKTKGFFLAGTKGLWLPICY
jgi:hypothetical protein